MADMHWLAAHPESRAADLMEVLQDPAIQGIISTIGGDDSIRIDSNAILSGLFSHSRKSQSVYWLLRLDDDPFRILESWSDFVLWTVPYGRLRREWRIITLHG
jgi:hypothetical protein